MLLESLRKQVLRANQEIARRGLAPHTFGNASGIDRSGAKPLVVIKPSGVDYAAMKPADLVITDLDGNIVEGSLRPSSDLDTHTLLYREFPAIGGIVHTHSEFATSWAQAGRPIPCLGTTHADTFHGAVPVTADLKADETEKDYEKNTGLAIVRAFAHVNPDSIPGVLVKSHGPFTWGADPSAAAHNSAILEAVARMAYYSTAINPAVEPIAPWLHDKHFLRKHGSSKYYGQPVKK